MRKLLHILCWQQGQDQFGYGEGDENSEIAFGGKADDKIITQYFRKYFQVEN